jgi:hypothetical protein
VVPQSEIVQLRANPVQLRIRTQPVEMAVVRVVMPDGSEFKAPRIRFQLTMDARRTLVEHLVQAGAIYIAAPAEDQKPLALLLVCWIMFDLYTYWSE